MHDRLGVYSGVCLTLVYPWSSNEQFLIHQVGVYSLRIETQGLMVIVKNGNIVASW